MDPSEVPTKGNQIRAKNSLALANQGYELMDKKRNILIRELMQHIEKAKDIQSEIDQTFRAAYAALQKANVELGIGKVSSIAKSIPIENSVEIHSRSIMGTEIPLVRYSKEERRIPAYAFLRTRDSLDEARVAFEKVKMLTLELSQIEITAQRLASDIQRTQKRANALQNITIPHYADLLKSISNALEEKEREEFTRLKVIKARKA
jgi:V/A-type H+-transporting ATPase subunit D